MKSSPAFGFTLPNLPKPIYTWLKDFRDRKQMSWLTAVVTAIKALEELEKRDAGQLEQVITWAKKF